MSILSRRHFLASGAASFAGVAAAAKLSTRATMAGTTDPALLRVDSRTIEVNGKAAKVFGLGTPAKTAGLRIDSGARLRIHLENATKEPTLVHWHGLLPPYGQDGAPGLPQALLPGGQSYEYDFPVNTPGTHWMHAHTLQEQRLLAAPLIVTDPADAGRDEQEVVVLLHDFSFKSPEELLAGLSQKNLASAVPSGGMDGMQMGDMPAAAQQGMTMDTNDIQYDAYLANDRTLDDPEIFRVEAGGTVRLRLINGATATAFWIDLGRLEGKAIAVDGNPIEPIAGRRFPLGMGQRIDIAIQLPKDQGSWPILALREGAVERTGFVLATRSAALARIIPSGTDATSAIDATFERSLRARQPLVDRPADRKQSMTLNGDMAAYRWTLNGQAWGQHTPIAVRMGERVEVTLINQSMMAHPMHLHGHHFQVVAAAGNRFSGAVRDTVWVPAMGNITIAFDAANPGEWAFHCHHLYHMASGMMTSVVYQQG
ncbi:multicopper oxidase family protein [Dongia sp.]|uniref:multicopper oxidase family protein n=1 Tax=Dongia sp. TaxID=1977262 RepID=UPI0037521864